MMRYRLLFAHMTTLDSGVTMDERLRRAVTAWRERKGVSARRFGADALGNPGFASSLARGRSVRLETADRVLAFIGYPPLGPAVRSELEAYIAVSGTKVSILGEEALNNPSFVGRFRRGVSPHLGTVDRVRAWAAAHASEEEVRTIRARLAEAAPAVHPFAGPEAEREFRMNGHNVDYLDTRKAAARLGIPPSTLERCRASCEGPAFHRFGGRVRYLPADLEAWASKQRWTSISEERSARRKKGR